MTTAARRRAVAVEARAKINLGLAVGPRRADGFHEMVTFFQSVSLADTLLVRRRARGFTLRVRAENVALRGGSARTRAVHVPSGADNLVLRAARLLAQRAGLRAGAEFRLVKRIPARAGLGGGSADAAAALRGLAALYGIRLAAKEWAELAAMLGSDVPFALRGGTALGRGRGERLTPLRLRRSFRALIALPTWSIATPAAFAAIDRRRNNLTAWGPYLRSAQVLGRERLTAERVMQFGNTFESVLGRRKREFEALRRRLEDAGAIAVRMTGSGSAVVGLLPNAREAPAAVRRFEGQEALFLVHSRGRGLKLITSS